MRQPELLAYIRQSRDKRQQVHSEQVQREEIERYFTGMAHIRKNNWPSKMTVFKDIAVSGRTNPFFSRTGGTELRRYAERGDIIVATKIDRIGRDSMDTVGMVRHFLKAGVAVHITSLGGIDFSTPIGGLILEVIAATAQFEGRLTLERTLETLKSLQAQGKPSNFNPRHDYKFVEINGEKREVYDDEFVALRCEIYQCYYAKNMTAPKIVAMLNQRGIVPPARYKKREWDARMIRSIVAHERDVRRMKGVA